MPTPLAVFWSYPKDAPGPTKAWKFGMDRIYGPFYNNLMIKDKGNRGADHAHELCPGCCHVWELLEESGCRSTICDS